jgi:hypothetical protein
VGVDELEGECVVLDVVLLSSAHNENLNFLPRNAAVEGL